MVLVLVQVVDDVLHGRGVPLEVRLPDVSVIRKRVPMDVTRCVPHQAGSSWSRVLWKSVIGKIVVCTIHVLLLQVLYDAHGVLVGVEQKDVAAILSNE